MKINKFHDTRHAKERSQERSISIDLLKDVVKYHERRTQQYRGQHGGFVYKFVKSVSGRTIAAVAETKKDECWLISGFEIQ